MDALLSDAEKVFIIHGVQVNFLVQLPLPDGLPIYHPTVQPTGVKTCVVLYTAL